MAAHKVCSASIAGFGALPLAKEGNTFKPSGVKREHIAGCNPEDGDHVKEPTAAELKVKLISKATLDVQALNQLDSAVITIKLQSGAAHVMTKAFGKEIEDLGDDGHTNMTFISNTSTRMNT